MNISKSSTPLIDYRLSTDLKPYFYELIIKPFFNVTFEPQSYQGHEIIKLKCLKSTSKLMIHMHSNIVLDNSAFEILDLNDSTLLPIRNLDSRYFIDKVTYESHRQLLVVEFVRNVFQLGHHYALTIAFSGRLRDDNVGFYKSTYKDSRGIKKWLMVDLNL